MTRWLTIVCMLACAPAPAADPQAPGPSPAVAMTNARIATLIERLDAEAVGADGQWRIVIADRAVMVITDARADRMRIIAPVTAADVLDEAALLRLMQANFDSALDARYAVAKGTLWAAFIHPLAALSDEEFLLGLGQVVNLANTFGTDYSSGLMLFGGGDSRGIRERELIEELVEKGLAI